MPTTRVVKEDVALILEKALKRVLQESEKKNPDFDKIKTFSKVAIQRFQEANEQ